MQTKIPEGLLEKIMKRIRREESILVVRRTILLSVSALASFSGFIYAMKMLLTDVAKSGFLYFFSLLFSDFSVVITSWKNFSLILLETLPAITVILFLMLLLAFLLSIKSLTKNIKTISHLQQISL